MDWNKYNSLQTAAKIRQAIRKDDCLTKDTYDATRMFAPATWNMAEFIKSEMMTRAAFVARCMLFGLDDKGHQDKNAKGRNRPLSDSMTIRIQVLSRQGCHITDDGDEVNVRPKDLDECVPHSDKPVPGDIVVVRQGMKEVNDDEKPLSGAERNRMVMSGGSIYYESQYEVDDDLCVDVSIEDALTLLSKGGHKIVMPEFKPKLSHLNRDEKKLERRVSNWLYKEVPQDFTIKKPKKQIKKKEVSNDQQEIR